MRSVSRIAIPTAVASLALCAIVASPVGADAVQPTGMFEYVGDIMITPSERAALEREAAEQAAMEAERLAKEQAALDDAQSEEGLDEAAEWDDSGDWYDDGYEYADYGYGGAYGGTGRIDAAYYGDGTDGPYETDGPSSTMPGYYNGRKETYYSSDVLYHYMTPEWTLDDDGFYRDDQGRYIVGVGIGEGYGIGDEIETGKGTAVVMDYGYTEGITDFYVKEIQH